jgi:ubiquinone/menaquinone biosynthesis C-methylase UbiE
MATLHFSPEITDDYVRTHERYLVPAIYAQWAVQVAEIAQIELGQHVLDVATGTGTLARAAQAETGLTGRVVGLDASEKMLKSAHQQSRGIEWKRGDATAMPFGKNEFDRVMCQFALMFIANRVATIKEMLRVCKPDGLVVLATWGPLQQGEAYETMIRLIQHHRGYQAASRLSIPWTLGKPGVMDAILLSSGVNEYECHERVGQACYPSIQSFVETHLRLAGEFDNLDKQDFAKIMDTAYAKLSRFATPGGKLIARLNVNIFTVRNV